MSQSGQSGAALGSPQTNSVRESEGGEPPESESRSFPTPEERVAEFVAEYPDHAKLPLSEVNGRKLREEVTVEQTEMEEWVVEDGPWAIPMQEEKVVARRAVTWAESVRRLLEWNEENRGQRGKFGRGRPDTPERKSFSTSLEDSFDPEYAKAEYAKLKALSRETVGGEYADVDLEREGAFDEPMIAFLSLTASTAPEGDLVPPVDHDRMVVDTWKGGDGVYQSLYRVLDRLGIEDFVYHRQGEPHPGGGLATGYRHDHVLVIFDAADLDEEPTGEDFRPVIETHVEKCEWAGEEAHPLDAEDPRQRAITVERVGSDGIANVAEYMSEYVSFDSQDLAERDIEYVAYSAIQWATNSQKHTRSTGANHAIDADLCRQKAADPDHDQELAHGEEVALAAPGAHHEFECRACGSPWEIDQDARSLTDHRRDDEAASGGAGRATRTSLRVAWSGARSAARVEAGGEVDGFERPPAWKLEAVVDADGEEYRPSGDGVEMKSLLLPFVECACGARVRRSELTCSACGRAVEEDRPPPTGPTQEERRESVLEAAEDGVALEALLQLPGVTEHDVSALLRNGRLYRVGGGELRTTA